MTPLQGQILDAADKKVAEEKEKKKEEIKSQTGPGGNQRRNPRANSGMGQSETVRYINKQALPEHDVHEN